MAAGPPPGAKLGLSGAYPPLLPGICELDYRNTTNSPPPRRIGNATCDRYGRAGNSGESLVRISQEVEDMEPILGTAIVAGLLVIPFRAAVEAYRQHTARKRRNGTTLNSAFTLPYPER